MAMWCTLDLTFKWFKHEASQAKCESNPWAQMFRHMHSWDKYQNSVLTTPSPKLYSIAILYL